jgi:hypothetical protein
MLDVVETCPLGSTCEEIIDGKIHRCAWYVRIDGETADGQKTSESKCSMAWNPILQVDNSRDARHNTAAVESLRNIFAEAIGGKNTTDKRLRDERA